jgi:hypothetical protein
MTTLEKAARQALDTLERTAIRLTQGDFVLPAIDALRAALAQQQAEPVAVTGAIDIDDLVTEFEIQSQDNAKAIAKGRKWVADSVLEEHPQQAELVAYCYVRKNSSADALTFDPNPVNAVEGTVFPLYAHPPQQAAPVAWRYKGEPWFDGDHWHDKYEVTTDERVARFKDKNAQPLYTAPQQAEPVAACVCGDPTSLGIVHHTDGPCFAPPQQAEPVAIPGAIPMAEVAARSRAMPERADALEAARERLKQAEPVADSGNPSF